MPQRARRAPKATALARPAGAAGGRRWPLRQAPATAPGRRAAVSTAAELHLGRRGEAQQPAGGRGWHSGAQRRAQGAARAAERGAEERLLPATARAAALSEGPSSARCAHRGAVGLPFGGQGPATAAGLLAEVQGTLAGARGAPKVPQGLLAGRGANLKAAQRPCKTCVFLSFSIPLTIKIYSPTAFLTSQDPSGYLGYAEDSAEQKRLLMWQKDVARVNSERLNVIRKYEMLHPEPFKHLDAMKSRLKPLE